MSGFRDRFVRLGDLSLHVQEWGDLDAPLLLLLHGLASTSHMFDLIAPPLAKHFHVVAPDQRGHGLSDKPAGGYDFETIAGDVDRLLDHYHADKAILFGHSWGAYTTLYYAAAHPQRVVKAGLIDGGIRALSDLYPTWEEAEVKLAPPTYVEQSRDDILRLIEVDWLGSVFRPELLPLALSIFDTSDPHDVHAHLSFDNHMKIARALWEMRPADYFARVRCPLLIVNAVAPGEAPDADVQAATDEAERLIPQARVIWMDESIHDIPWHRPQELVDVLLPFVSES